MLGLLAGLLFARGEPRTAARLLLSDLVEIEQVQAGSVVGGALPTSGPVDGAVPECGVRVEPLDTDVQLARLAAGVVLVQHPGDLDGATLEVLHQLAAEDRPLLIAPHPDVGDGVVATGWTRRLVRDEVDVELLDTFVTAYAGAGSSPQSCP